MTTITPERFMTWTEPDEDEFDPTSWAACNPATPGSVESVPRQIGKTAMGEIFEALQRIEGHIAGQSSADLVAAEMHEALADLGAQHDTITTLIEQIEAIIKPSTSKLANQVRDAIKAWRAPEVPAEPAGEHNNDHDAPPEHDADIEVWREWARGRTNEDVDGLNRSQIRTALGIGQPGAKP